MNLTGNTILITGGGSGIGRGLAEALHALGNQVIIAGRRPNALNDTTAANPGMKSLILDIQDPADIRAFAARVTAKFPSLNVLVNNAGIMRAEKLHAQQPDLADAEAIVTTNLLGPIRLTAALVFTPTYCATKAAIHSYTESLRYQLKSTSIEVLELIPPYVQTNLMEGAEDPLAMPLDKFIAEVMEILKTKPTPAEIRVQNVNGLRLAAEQGRYDATLNGLNAAMAGRF